MNRCRHCGAFVPIEKAFCPNCSEPMEPEEAPNRAASSSSDMMSTMRDDPEQYREILQMLKKKPATTEASEAPSSTPDPVRAAPPVPTYNTSQIAPDVAPPAKNNKRNLVLIISTLSVLVLLFVMLLVFKVI